MFCVGNFPYVKNKHIEYVYIYYYCNKSSAGYKLNIYQVKEMYQHNYAQVQRLLKNN